jgi:LPPG:FO 2-phospho-L-lactate transferase
MHANDKTQLRFLRMNVVALAGGVGAGKFLRGLVRAVEPRDLTVIVNTGDDMTLHGLHISPDIDSVMYWLSGLADRARGWGRTDESFRALDEVRRLGGESWFGLGDLDLATHLVRTHLLGEGRTLSEATAHLTGALGIAAPLLPMSDDPVATMVHAVTAEGEGLYMHFQVYWVQRGARDRVTGVRYEGAEEASPAPGATEALAAADVVLVCPSNPVASIRPILAVGGIRRHLEARGGAGVVGVSPIVGGAPLRGMADRLMPAAGLEVSALGAAAAYPGLLSGWVIDDRDRHLVPRIEEELGVQVAVTDTVMTDDRAAERVARAALEVAAG